MLLCVKVFLILHARLLLLVLRWASLFVHGFKRRRIMRDNPACRTFCCARMALGETTRDVLGHSRSPKTAEIHHGTVINILSRRPPFLIHIVCASRGVLFRSPSRMRVSLYYLYSSVPIHSDLIFYRSPMVGFTQSACTSFVHAAIVVF